MRNYHKGNPYHYTQYKKKRKDLVPLPRQSKWFYSLYMSMNDIGTHFAHIDTSHEATQS